MCKELKALEKTDHSVYDHTELCLYVLFTWEDAKNTVVANKQSKPST